MNHQFKCIIIFIALGASGCQGPNSDQDADLGSSAMVEHSAAERRSGYHVKIGDQLDVFVLEDKSFNGSFSVRETGEIIIPQLGRVMVLGFTLLEVEQAVKRQLEGSQLKVATVIVDPSSSVASADKPTMGTVVRISGRVSTTGRVTVPQLGGSKVTVFQAVNEMGGTLPFADKKRSYILRSSGDKIKKIPVNLQRIEEGTMPDVPIYEGDTIVVPPKVIGF